MDLSATAHWIADLLAARSPSRTVSWVIAPGLVVDADRGLAQELMEQLLGNAWKFTSKNETARIELGREAKDGEEAFFVRDDGAGFDMAHSGQLFGTFHRAHTEKEFPGLGIGLAVAEKVVHRHGGRIWAEGAVGQGATFWFTLPPGSPPPGSGL